ncbi:MAG: hypothetical protein AAGF28_09380 [Pseudomonadota bacterium]
MNTRGRKSGIVVAGAAAACVALAGCVQTSAPVTQVNTKDILNRQAALAAECRLLALAYEKALEIEKANGTIVEGCPGYENVPVVTNQFTQASSFSRAASASLPLDASAKGPAATRIFQRMISRGTPAGIAEQLTTTPEFAAAVKAARRA